MGLGRYTPLAQGDTSTPRTSLLPPAPWTPMRTPGTPRAASRRSLRPIAAGQSDMAPRAARWGCWGDAALTWVTLGEGWHRPGGGGGDTGGTRNLPEGTRIRGMRNYPGRGRGCGRTDPPGEGCQRVVEQTLGAGEYCWGYSELAGTGQGAPGGRGIDPGGSVAGGSRSSPGAG